ncbi:MAG TPA: decaprenyl-phosphate phosphoribosyltransferase [Candidatus Omnitrophota bacterium]|nr:decaprenyl-phosphate phosphoribosyltransferase [Candidatus Omnitrophota bacterium]
MKGKMKTVKNIIISMRPSQWTKNFFIFMPIIFGGHIFNRTEFLKTIYTYFLFCLISAGIYIFNDICDKTRDGFHPVKKIRPIASGELGIKTALPLSIIFVLAGAFLSSFFGMPMLMIAAAYILIHIFYSLWLKREVMLDVMIIALGFELRVWAGATAIDLTPSVWLQLCVFLLAIFLALIKRRHERTSLNTNAKDHRDVLASYKIYFLDQLIIISASLCIVFYGLYTISPEMMQRIGSPSMAYTIPFVIYGIFRYLYITHVQRLGGEPDKILISDPPFIINLVLWLVTASLLIYTK